MLFSSRGTQGDGRHPPPPLQSAGIPAVAQLSKGTHVASAKGPVVLEWACQAPENPVLKYVYMCTKRYAKYTHTCIEIYQLQNYFAFICKPSPLKSHKSQLLYRQVFLINPSLPTFLINPNLPER